MRINTIQIYNYVAFKGKTENNNKSFSLKRLTSDVFQKTTDSIEKTKRNKLLKSNGEIGQYYNEVFDKILMDVPVMKLLGVEKPKLIFNDKMEANAAYDFTSNTIELNPIYQEDFFACFEYGENDELQNCGIYNRTDFEGSLEQIKARSAGYQIRKLTPEEKELHIKSILVHELRHWTQEHIIASTKGCQEPYERRLGKVKELINTLEEIIIVLKENGAPRQKIKEYQAKLADAKKQHSYILSYKPKVVLSEDYKLPVSALPYENQYWSVKDHLLKAALSYSNSDDAQYSTNPKEIDAYNYQADYIVIEESKPNTKVRAKVVEAMLMGCAKNGFSAMERLEEFGYPPLLSE